jgi:PAS domain-containing protein
MGVDTAEFGGLLNLLYEGLLRPEAWGDFLSRLGPRIGCEQAAVTFHDAENRHPEVISSVGMSAALLQEWTCCYGSKHPRKPEFDQRLLEGSTLLSNTTADAQSRDTEYNDWLRRRDIYFSMLLMSTSGDGVGALSLARPRSARPFAARDTAWIWLLAPHFQRAMQLYATREALCAFVEAEQAAMNQLDAAIVAVDQDGRAVLMNAGAESIVRQQRTLLVRGGRLAARHPLESDLLDNLVRSAAKTGAGLAAGSGGAITIHGDGSAPLRIVVTPFHSRRALAKGRPCALVFLCDPSGKPAPRSASLRTLFGLTPAECRLADSCTKVSNCPAPRKN